MDKNYNVAGIYKIVNKTNGKFYIGSSTNILNRWKKHEYDLKSNLHHNKYLQRAWDKYGESSFEFKIVEIVDDIDLLEDVEQKWLNNTKCYIPEIGYNLSDNSSRPSINSNKSIVKLTRTDLQKVILNGILDKNENHVLFVFSAFISKYNNSVKINNKYPTPEILKNITGFGKSKLYEILKTLEDKGFIKKTKVNKDYIIYLNPYLFKYDDNIDKCVYDYFTQPIN